MKINVGAIGGFCLVLGLGFGAGYYTAIPPTTTKTQSSEKQFYDDKNFLFFNAILGLIGNTVTIITGSTILTSWYLMFNRGQIPYSVMKFFLQDNNGLLYSDTKPRVNSSIPKFAEPEILEPLLYELNGVAKKAGLTTGLFNSITTPAQFLFEAKFDKYPIIPEIYSTLKPVHKTTLSTNAIPIVQEILVTWEGQLQNSVTGGQFYCLQKALTVNLIGKKLDTYEITNIWEVIHKMFADELATKAVPLNDSELLSILPLLKWYVMNKRDEFETLALQLTTNQSSNFSTDLYNLFNQYTQ
jgi:hypothetical protein